MKRTILHLDLDAFFCAVEEIKDASLRGKPFAVGGSPTGRGVVASCSYPARVYGIHSAMPMANAVRLCPDLIIVRSDFRAYRDYSNKVRRILESVTPLVEPISIDEAFLDVTGIQSDGQTIAVQLQARINAELSLPSSLGVASNKLVAKIANNIGKARHEGTGETPNHIEIVPPGTEADFLAPLPVRALWGIGAKTAERLATHNIHTVGDIAAQSPQRMQHLFGKHGLAMWQHARGVDTRPVETEHEAKSVSKETTFMTDVTNRNTLEQTIRRLAEEVAHRLRSDDLSGSTVRLKLRWDDFTTLTRQTTLPQPTHDDHIITKTALNLFADNWMPGQPVRLVGVGVSNLDQTMTQLDLFQTEDTKRRRKLQNTLDEIRDRFGDETLRRASDFNRKRRRD